MANAISPTRTWRSLFCGIVERLVALIFNTARSVKLSEPIKLAS